MNSKAERYCVPGEATKPLARFKTRLRLRACVGPPLTRGMVKSFQRLFWSQRHSPSDAFRITRGAWLRRQRTAAWLHPGHQAEAVVVVSAAFSFAAKARSCATLFGFNLLNPI